MLLRYIKHIHSLTACLTKAKRSQVIILKLFHPIYQLNHNTKQTAQASN